MITRTWGVLNQVAAPTPTPTPSPSPIASTPPTPLTAVTTLTTVPAPSGSVIQVVQTAGSTTAQTITLVAAIIAALAALGAAAVAAFVQRKTGAELDQWRKREETMRMLRWGADHAIKAKDDPVASKAGQAALELLKTSQLVQPEDKVFIEQVVASIVDRPAEDVNPEDEVVFDDEQ